MGLSLPYNIFKGRCFSLKTLIEVFESIVKTIMGTEPVKLDLIYPELRRPEIHRVTKL